MDFTRNVNRKAGSANKNGRVEDGTYPARIVQIVDLGIQKNEWQGEEKLVDQVMITFEFPTETVEIEGEQKPRWLSKQYTKSMNEKAALYKLVEAVDPDGKTSSKGKHPRKLLGLPCMVTVGSTVSGNAKIVDTSRLMKGLAVDDLYNPAVYFDLASTDKTIFDTFPDWLQNKIKEAVNFETTHFFKHMNDAPLEDKNPF